MLYSVPFAHSASECPAADKMQMLLKSARSSAGAISSPVVEQPTPQR